MVEITQLKQVVPEKPKTIFFAILAAQKFIALTKIQIHVTGSIFIIN